MPPPILPAPSSGPAYRLPAREFLLAALLLGGALPALAEEPVANAGLNGNEGDGKGGYVPRAGETIHAGADWLPYDHRLDIEPGSAFDFSFLADAPAGKYGTVVATAQGHLEGEQRPGVPLRFWGVNVCSEANFLDHDDADRLAERLARSGYNAVRIHHYDRPLMRAGGPPGAFDPDKLDRLDYWFAALKKRGVYVSLDLYCNNTFPREQVPDLGRDIKTEIKLLIPVSDSARTAWETFARNLMTHRNSYTGLAWGEDPALLSVCPVNEDTPFLAPSRIDPAIAALYDQAFQHWKAARPAGDKEADGALFNRFLVETRARADRQAHAFLRSLGVRALLTGSNYQDREAQAYLRENYDAVDDHNYWNHPAFLGRKWNLPIQANPNSVLAGSVWHPRETMPSRVFGKPFLVTESNFVWPNAHRAEGGIVVSAYAGLQDWDAVFTFDYAEQAAAVLAPAAPSQAGFVFSLATDPVGLLADRAAALMFRRGDIRPAPRAFCYVASQKEAFSGPAWDPPKFPAAFSWLGLRARIGNLTAESPGLASAAKAAGVVAFVGPASVPGIPSLPADDKDLAGTLTRRGLLPAPASPGLHASETGQIELCTDGWAKTTSGASECFVLPPNRELAGPRVTVRNGPVPASLYVVSLDGSPLDRSPRLLLLYLTDSVPSGTQFADNTHRILEAFGTLPHLVRRGSASVSLRVTEPGAGWRLFPLAADGRRGASLPCASSANGLAFEVGATSGNDAALAYELVAPIP